MSDHEATRQVGIGTERSLDSPLAVPDQTQRAALMGQLSGGILHEFNNILTVISGTIDILAQAVNDRPELAAITRLIDEAALRGTRLTAHLLAFERGQPPQYRAVDVSTLLSDAVRLLRPVLGGQIEISLSTPPDPMMAVVDPGLLMAAVLKLAIAARNVIPDSGRISMAVPVGGGAVDEAIEIRVDAVGSAMSDRSLDSSAGDLGSVEELVGLSGGNIAVDPHVDHVGFKIRLRKAAAGY